LGVVLLCMTPSRMRWFGVGGNGFVKTGR
jgi:hypothetical protein